MSHQYRWRTDFDKFVLTYNFERRRGWRKSDSDEDWNFYWANVHNVKQLFHPDSGTRLGDHQVVNHFPNHFELTRKDTLVKNIKRYRREMERESSADPSKVKVPEIIPMTYVLPIDYSLFVEEFRRFSNQTWIMKPTAKAQGVGIFLINKLSQVKKWANRWSSLSAKDWYVVSRYVDNPLLIGGKKFDLRIYVLVVNYRPLRVYLYQMGFARFCNEKYSSDLGDIDNQFIHLTNVAIQKKSEDYNRAHGGKWHLNNLRLFVEGIHGKEASQRLFDEVNAIIIHSLKACQNVMINDKHCFECYGYDLLIDSNLKPWLIEVNASPSLTATTHPDRILKTGLISDMLDIVMPPDLPPDVSHKGMRWDPEEGLVPVEKHGFFDLLYDEAADTTATLQPTGGRGKRRA